MARNIGTGGMAARGALLIAVLGLGVMAGLAWTDPQAPGGPGPDRLPPLVGALDANHDGVVSSEELAAAPASLLALDRNGDGALQPEEVRPAFGRGFREGGPGGRRGRGDEPGETPPTSPDELVTTLMSFDRDGDGKLSRAEMPERMQGLFDRADADKDGFLTAGELKQSAAGQPDPAADPRFGRGEHEGEREGGGRRGRGPGGPMRDPVFAALDANHDGTLAGDELAAATASLRSLDVNNDGQLTLEEIRPAFGRGPDRF